MDIIEKVKRAQELVDEITSVESILSNLKNALHQLPYEMGEMQCPDEQRALIAKFLYWNTPVDVLAIYEGLLKTHIHKALNIIGPVLVRHDVCVQCQIEVPVYARKRSDLKPHPRQKWKPVFYCEECEKHRDEERSRRYKESSQRREARLHELRTMPYADYLQTPEWNETRLRALKRAGFRCQLCNEGGTILDVHHRTYERRGCEYAADLITLCRSCHSIFHGKA